MASSTETFRVTPEEAGIRLDSLLVGRLEGYSRGFVQKLIKQGFVRVCGSARKSAYCVKPGDLVEVEIPEPDGADEPIVVPVPVPLDVLYEDEHIVVVNKPAGMVVHPGAGKESVSLVHALLYRYGSLASVGAPERPGIVHRLDENTTGVMIVARTDRAYWELVKQFEGRTVQKEYLALVWGVPPEETGTVSTLINRHPRERKKMAVTQNGREAVTKWKVLKTWKEVSLLSVKPITGRTHQIRVHMAYIHHPIVGDPLYCRHERRVNRLTDFAFKDLLKDIKRQMLHARMLRLKHPVSGEILEWQAPLPPDMERLLKSLDALEGVTS
ncbi:RluA family pseudouridine synthase [Thermodesulforhabdus norvegica]|uniref:Pseudouridine synthase n=1 Tax=Thermodesulforhabdus norvegica TaxID=39841 RepID=A0A1I4W630_9BACT|nr:RluA family pseudouridine synthase [Thermodesulforhabdus norvegica]SFN08933.1 ribosomal large subunit pseudouridine synthase D [Thermodesulforhabdus norvegica]